MNIDWNLTSYSTARIRLTAVFIFGWYLFNVAIHYPFINLLWGESNVFWRGSVRNGLIENLVYHLLYAPVNASRVISLHIISASISVFSFKYVGLFRFMAWLTGWMLYLPANGVFDSGMLVVQSFAFLLIFQQNGTDKLSHEINGMICWALVVILITGYIASSAFKLSGIQWWQGTAFYYSMHLEYLTGKNFTFFIDFAKKLWVSKLFTWSSLLYQILFPIIIFSKRFAFKWVMIGVVFHLLTIVFFNLWGFAFAMIASYCILIPGEWAEKIGVKAIRE